VGGYYTFVDIGEGQVLGNVYLGMTALSNGNYVVSSPQWNGQRGAVTWGDGTMGVTGLVSAANSLVGTLAGDQVGYPGSYGVTPLSNGNYVVSSPKWNGQRGAVTWGDGSTGIRGAVSAANSLVGANSGDQVGSGYTGTTPLSNGNYVVPSPLWNGQRGAVTWGSGTAGVNGPVSEANSLVGSSPGDFGAYRITPLTNGSYVLSTPLWNNNRGAATWGSSTAGVSGPVSAGISLVGTTPSDGSYPGDRVATGGATALTGGAYVVDSPLWNGARGAATWGSGTAGVSGPVSDANSLVGSHPVDQVGEEGSVTPLSNGNYVVVSGNASRGAATWGSGTAGISGPVSEANSLVGTSPNDFVGYRVTPLSNGNYVVSTPSWNNNRGAATWASGTAGVSGPVSADISLVGTTPSGGGNLGDQIGYYGAAGLSNGNYVVSSPLAIGSRGAVTWGSGTTGVSGTISDANSLIGSNPGDEVGYATEYLSGITPLSNGNYVVASTLWNGFRGAVTWGDGSTVIQGTVSAGNSLVGTSPNDRVGYIYGTEVVSGITPLANGNYAVASVGWNAGRGAVTWGSGTGGVSGPVSAANSVVGSNPLDNVGLASLAGESGVTPVSSGNYVIRSPFWNGHRGAATWVSGTNGQTTDGQGLITPQNSLLGHNPNGGLGTVAEDALHQSILAAFPRDGTGRVAAGLEDPNHFPYGRAQDQTVTLPPDFLTAMLNNGTDVVLQASNDITVEDPITVGAAGQGGSLTLEAGRSILLNAEITTDNGDLTLIANDYLANGVIDSQRDPGTAVIAMAPGTSIDAGGGTVTVNLRNGSGKTNRDFGALTLGPISAGTVHVLPAGTAPTSLVGRSQADGQWLVGLSNGADAFTNVGADTWDPSVTWVDVHTGDFTGDGNDDIVGRDLQTGEWSVAVYDGAGHFSTSVWDTWDPTVHWVDVRVGDFDGDGRLDIGGRAQGDGSWWVGLSTGSGFATSAWGGWDPGVPWEDVQVGDLTGDGRADLLGRTPDGQWWAALSDGTSFSNTLWTTWAPDSANLTWVDVHLADVTGDGKVDLVGRWLQTGQWWVSTSGGAAASSTDLWDAWSSDVTWADVQVGDFNGDGRADLIGRALESGQWWLGTSTGAAFADSLWVEWSPAVNWADVQVGDFNGDGRADVAGRVPSSGEWWVSLSGGSAAVSTAAWAVWSPAATWVDVHHGHFG
jgi:hypothetical protein